MSHLVARLDQPKLYTPGPCRSQGRSIVFRRRSKQLSRRASYYARSTYSSAKSLDGLPCCCPGRNPTAAPGFLHLLELRKRFLDDRSIAAALLLPPSGPPWRSRRQRAPAPAPTRTRRGDRRRGWPSAAVRRTSMTAKVPAPQRPAAWRCRENWSGSDHARPRRSTPFRRHHPGQRQPAAKERRAR
jgi:hypothetical protein